MARCGCSGSSCSCIIQSGTGVVVSGSGTAGNPYIISANTGSLTIADSPTVDLTLTGDGSPGTPYELSADVILDPSGDNLLIATAQGLLLDCAAITAGCGITAYSFNDGATIDFTAAGANVTAEVKIDNGTAQLLTATASGLRVLTSSVRGAFSASNGVAYNSATGAFSAQLSADANNAVVLGSDGGLYVAGSGIAATGVQIVRRITATGAGTWTNPGPAGGLKGVWVYCTAGGGGSGGVAATSSQLSPSAGGGGGATVAAWIDISVLGASNVAYSVGAGGTAGTSGPTNGGNGGDSNFGAFLSASGGLGGASAAAGTSTAYSNGGGTGGGTFGGTASPRQDFFGQTGDNGVRLSATDGHSGDGGAGGMFGTEARGRTTTGTGLSGRAPGGGAAGSMNIGTQSAAAGAAGARGELVIVEYY
jgi:hypothetical protein